MTRRGKFGAALAAAGLLACNRPVSTEVVTPKILARPPKSFPALPFDQLQPVYTAPLAVDLRPDQIESTCSEVLGAAEARFTDLLGIPPAVRTFDTSVKAFEEALADASEATARLSILEAVHPRLEVRQAAAACRERGAKWLAQTLSRPDLFQSMQGFAERPGALQGLDAVDHRLIEVTLQRFRRHGAALSEPDRKALLEAQARLVEVETRFVLNLAEDSTTVPATEAELRGVPQPLRARWSRDAKGTWLIPARMPDAGNVMETAKNEELRRRLWTAFHSRQAERNLPLLDEAVRLRDRTAQLLGFQNHAEAVADVCIARSSRTASAFVERIHEQLKPARTGLDGRMRTLKVRETGNRKAVLESSDLPYYLAGLERRELQFDEERTRAYFPADRVLEGMFHAFSAVLGVNFVRGQAITWAPEVAAFEVHDGGPEARLLAKFYLDLYPRPGKYPGSATFPLTVGHAVPEGYQVPLSVVVVNFTPPPPGGTARFKLSEVVTLFHEFGHLMHASLATTRYASLGALQVPLDFRETPAQLFESWVYQPEVLAMISRDPVDPSATMPMPLVEQVIASRALEAPERYSRQAMLAVLDLRLHTARASASADALEHQVRAAFDPFPPLDEQSAASFLPVMTGRDGAVYGFLWARVYAADCFTRFEQEGVLSPEEGRRLRDQLLAPGWSQEPEVLLKKFLGRAPDEAAFLRQLGIGSGNPKSPEGKSGPGR